MKERNDMMNNTTTLPDVRLGQLVGLSVRVLPQNFFPRKGTVVKLSAQQPILYSIQIERPDGLKVTVKAYREDLLL